MTEDWCSPTVTSVFCFYSTFIHSLSTAVMCNTHSFFMFSPTRLTQIQMCMCFSCLSKAHVLTVILKGSGSLTIRHIFLSSFFVVVVFGLWISHGFDFSIFCLCHCKGGIHAGSYCLFFALWYKEMWNINLLLYTVCTHVKPLRLLCQLCFIGAFNRNNSKWIWLSALISQQRIFSYSWYRICGIIFLSD